MSGELHERRKAVIACFWEDRLSWWGHGMMGLLTTIPLAFYTACHGVVGDIP